MENEQRARRRALGRRMREAARQAGLDSAQIGRRLGVGASTVRHWWNGNTEIPAGRLDAYATLVGRPMAQLMGDAAADALFHAGARHLLDELLAGQSLVAVIERLHAGAPFTPERLAGLELDVTAVRTAVERHTGRPWAELSPSERAEVIRVIQAQLGGGGGGNGRRFAAHPVRGEPA